MKSESRGFISIEILIVLIVISLAIVQGSRLYGEYLDGLNQQMAAQQQIKVAEAGSKYIKDNFAAVLAAAGPTAPAVITVTMLKNTKYLPTGFSDQNIYGQDYRILARKPQANQLETLIITTGGSAAEEIDIRRVAQIIGAQGGYISATNTTVAQGTAWQVPLSNYGVSPGAGRLATALFFQDGAIANDYLYRNAVPGKPELNEMNTALGMRGNNINAVGAITASGNIMTSADISGRNITATSKLSSATAEITGETYTGGWFRTRGDGGWYSEKWGGGWYMSDSTWVRSWMNKSIYTGGQVRGGEVRSDGRTYVGEYLQLSGVATEGAGCAPDGLVGRNAAGTTLSCQSGVWKMAGIVNVERVRTYTYLTNAELPRFVEVSAFCPVGKKVLSGGCNFNGYSNQVDFDESFPEPDMQSWKCAMKVAKLYQEAWYTGIEATAVCANY